MLYSHHHASYKQNIQQSSQQQSSCSQCKRNNYGIRQQQQEDQSSLQIPERNNTQSSQQDEVSIPLRKQINQKNYKFQQMLKILQYEVDSLKRQNQTKDVMIKQLKFQMHKTAVQQQRKLQSNKQAYQINRLRQQLGCSPRNKFNLPNKGFHTTKSFQQLNPVSEGFDKHQNNHQLYNQSIQYLKQNLNNQAQYLHHFNKAPQLGLKKNSDYQLRITILQNQIREYQLELMQNKQKINQLEQQTKWQQKFINSFVKMCDQLSLNYGQKLKLNKLGNDLKKKTKICWNYMKNLISFFIQNNNFVEQNDSN